MTLEKIIEDAKWVVTLFDQANTNKAIENLGSRGELLASAVEDLRKSLKDSGIDPYDVQGEWSIGHGPLTVPSEL